MNQSHLVNIADQLHSLCELRFALFDRAECSSELHLNSAATTSIDVIQAADS